jgi:hypothetical protein
MCKQQSYEYSAGCEFNAGQNKDVCLCGKYASFGSLCDEKQLCKTGLFCGAFEAGKPGFCSKTCTTDANCSGAPFGTDPRCNLDLSGQKACGFYCDGFLVGCPTGMKCDEFASLCRPG